MAALGTKGGQVTYMLDKPILRESVPLDESTVLARVRELARVWTEDDDGDHTDINRVYGRLLVAALDG